MNDNKNKDDDLLNNYNKFNMKMLKIRELKLYINNKYIANMNNYSHYIYNKIFDINYKLIDKINLLNLNDFDIEIYNGFNGYYKDKNCIKIYIYSNLYLESKKKVILEKSQIKIIEDKIEDIKIINHSYIMNNETSTILNEEELNVLDWLNN